MSPHDERGRFLPTDRQLKPSEVHKYARTSSAKAEILDNSDEYAEEPWIKRMAVTLYLGRRNTRQSCWVLTPRNRKYGWRTKSGKLLIDADVWRLSEESVWALVLCGITTCKRMGWRPAPDRLPEGWGHVGYHAPGIGDQETDLCPIHFALVSGTGNELTVSLSPRQ